MLEHRERPATEGPAPGRAALPPRVRTPNGPARGDREHYEGGHWLGTFACT